MQGAGRRREEGGEGGGCRTMRRDAAKLAMA